MHLLLDGDLVHRGRARRRGAGRRRDHGRRQRLRARSRRPRARASSAPMPAVRGLFERRLSMVERRRSVSKPVQEARPRPGHRPQGAQPGPQGRPADRASSPRRTPRSRSSERRCGSPASPAPTPTAPRGSTGSPTPSAADVGLEHGLALPGVGRPAARRGRGPRDARPEGLGRFHPVPAARGAGGPEGAHGLAQAGRGRRTAHRRPASRARADDRQGRGRAPPAVDLPDRRDRRHLRGHPAGPAGRPGGRRRDRRDPVHRPVAARLRARGRHPGGVRRHLRDPGELPADAGGARRDEQGARPLRAADQLRQRPVHARDRRAGRPRAARHDAQRLHVRHPLPRHQPGAHLRRPAVQPAGARPRRHHHQHRRGQLPHHRRRRRGRAHGHHQPAAQRVLRQGGRASRTGSSAWGTPSRSTPTCPTRSGWSWPTRCSPASCSRRLR